MRKLVCAVTLLVFCVGVLVKPPKLVAVAVDDTVAVLVDTTVSVAIEVAVTLDSPIGVDVSVETDATVAVEVEVWGGREDAEAVLPAPEHLG